MDTNIFILGPIPWTSRGWGTLNKNTILRVFFQPNENFLWHFDLRDLGNIIYMYLTNLRDCLGCWTKKAVSEFVVEHIMIFFYLSKNTLCWETFSGRHVVFRSINVVQEMGGMTLLVGITQKTGRDSSIGSVFAWYASGLEFDPHVRHILSWRLCHENISTAILRLPLIQEEPLSVTGERMCTKYW